MEFPVTGEEFLKTIRKNNPSKRLIDNELAEYKSRMNSISAPPPDRERVDGGGIPSGIDGKLANYEEYRDRLFREADEMQGWYNLAHTWIDEIEDKTQAHVLWSYYGLNNSEDKIASIVMFSRQSIYKIRKRGIKRFNDIYREKMRNFEISS